MGSYRVIDRIEMLEVVSKIDGDASCAFHSAAKAVPFQNRLMRPLLSTCQPKTCPAGCSPLPCASDSRLVVVNPRLSLGPDCPGKYVSR
jgi:hypothetical protein